MTGSPGQENGARGTGQLLIVAVQENDLFMKGSPNAAVFKREFRNFTDVPHIYKLGGKRMARVNYSDGLREEYQRLFDTCNVREDRNAEIEGIVSTIEANRQRYDSVEKNVGVPWYCIAVIHSMEASLRFDRHLHNGDPLTVRTVNVPSGRPKIGSPPFTWEESATDALAYDRLDKWEDWSLPGILYKLEGYNGWGYRLYHPHVLSPYLWSYSDHYRSGKYIADGRWSDTAVSKQAGAAVILRRMAEKGMFELLKPDLQYKEPLIKYSPSEKSIHAENLQRFLNQCPGIYVKVDGYPGEKTSEAFQKVSGFYLRGDPRV
jgi:lysozyme family protein